MSAGDFPFFVNRHLCHPSLYNTLERFWIGEEPMTEVTGFQQSVRFFSLTTRLHLPFCLLSCFICPMHCLPAVSYSDSLSDILTLTVLLRCRLFKWTLTTAPTLPRGTVASLSGYFRFRSACLHVTGFTRCWVNSYF